MTLVLRDSIDAPLIPRDTPVVAGYGDGIFLWSPAWKASGGLPAGANWWDLFPHSVKLVIVVRPGDRGDIADIEASDFAPADAPAFVRDFNRPGRRAATLYCSRSTWPQVIAQLRAAGIDPAGPRVDWWIATLDGTTNVGVPPGGKPPVAVQVFDTGDYDESIILDPSWVGIAGGAYVLDPNDPNDSDVISAAKSWLNPATAGSKSLLDELSETYYGNSPGFKALAAQVAALLSAEGVEKAAIDALAANGAAATAVAALAASQADLKKELDTVAGVVASGTPPDLTALGAAVAAVDAHVATLSTHLGVGTA